MGDQIGPEYAVTPLDFTLSKTHAYIILTLPGRVVIQKRSADFKVKSYRYVDFGETPLRGNVDSMACNASGCTLVGEAGGKLALMHLVPGRRKAALTITRIRYLADIVDPTPFLPWRVVRDGDRDFVSGWTQLLFKKGEPVAKGRVNLLDHTLGLVPGKAGVAYAFGINDGNAAYEKLDAKGTLLGDHEFDFGYANSRINALRRLPDGRILIIGHAYQYYHFFRTFAALLTPEGKPIWSRTYNNMDSMYGLVADPGHARFYTIDGGNMMAEISLKDGKVITRVETVRGLKRLFRTAGGQIVGIGKEKRSYGEGDADKTTQPVVFCLQRNGDSFKAGNLGSPGGRIAAAALWKKGVVVAYISDKEGSARSDALLGRIDPKTCTMTFDWTR